MRADGDFQPGDRTGGFIFGSDGQWHPLAMPPQVASPPGCGYRARWKRRVGRTMLVPGVLMALVFAVSMATSPEFDVGLSEVAGVGVLYAVIFGLPLSVLVALFPSRAHRSQSCGCASA